MEACDRLPGGGVALPAAAAAGIAELGRIALADLSLEQVLERVGTLARDVIPGVTEASVTLIVNDRPSTAAFTGPLALELDERQYRHGYGPCLDAARGGEIMLIPDMAAETRWPHYCPEALSRGARSGLSVPLPIQEHVLGALNLYGDTPNAFSPETVDVPVLFASYAAVAVANAHLYATTAELAEGMRQAMVSRAVIEQAKGILMGQRGCSAEEAFNQLTALSQHTNRKLRDVAAGLVARAQRPAVYRPGAPQRGPAIDT
ncbi:GAF and ANTAR domain-containing protein [Cryptosporangium aurantiacum]|uniref:GAF domain-containing protein n=1 Tax=Cryptosporangium aurantiacum TaxID=134849 RepID=A0A1M7PBZ7_9ACTN|nr:GAF and ANTAR domain-containing protein [Cryptosporangium aurantiacum]SHN14377.1 GAF domain-containing protein [Cryptosporangium aurantiacum]